MKTLVKRKSRNYRSVREMITVLKIKIKKVQNVVAAGLGEKFQSAKIKIQKMKMQKIRRSARVHKINK